MDIVERPVGTKEREQAIYGKLLEVARMFDDPQAAINLNI